MSSEELSTMRVSVDYWLCEEKSGHIFMVVGYDQHGAYIMRGVDDNRPFINDEL